VRDRRANTSQLRSLFNRMRKADKGDIWCSVPTPRERERFTFGSFLYKKADILFGIG